MGLQLSPLSWVGFFAPRRRSFCSAGFADGVGDGLAIADAVVLVPVVPDCGKRREMPIRTATTEIGCLLHGIYYYAAQNLWLS